MLEKRRGEILLIGKMELFSKDEICAFIASKGLTISQNYNSSTVAVVEGRGLKMFEELLSEEAYSDGVVHYRLEELEQIISARLKPDEVLMALKLGKDKERLLRLLSNEYIDDEFFLRLLSLYEWEGAELMDSEQDRRVLISLMQRFLKLSVYEQDALHSPSTLLRLIRTTKSSKLLEAILELPPFEFRVGRGKRITISQAIAMRPILNSQTVKKLLKYRDESIDLILASNPSLTSEFQNYLWKQRGEEVALALALNSSLNEELFDILLLKNGEILETLLSYQPIDRVRFKKIIKCIGKDSEYISYIGKNTLLTQELIYELLNIPDYTLKENLARNETISSDILNIFFEKEEFHLALAQNRAIDDTLAKSLFDRQNPNILEALSANPSTPKDLLQNLYNLGEFRYYQGLASNPSTPMPLLHQLKTDHRLWLILQKNENFVKEANREMGMR